MDDAYKRQHSLNFGLVQRQTGTQQRGVALAMLLWFLAAMTLLVASIGNRARIDVRLTQLHVAEAKAKAAADGAMPLMLAEVFAGRAGIDDVYDGRSTLSRRFDFDGTFVDLQLVPLISLLNINTATRDQLIVLLRQRLALSSGLATDLADEVIKWRTSTGLNSSGEPVASGPFRAIEDLLLLESMNRTSFEALRDFIFVAPTGSLNSLFRLDAYVTEGERRFLRRRWVNTGQRSSVNLPWRYFRTEAIRAAGPGSK